ASTATGSLPPLTWRGSPARSMRQRSVAEVVAVRLRDDSPAVGEFHRDQIVGEIAGRQLASHLDERGGFVGTVDAHDDILARLALGLGGWPRSDAIEPVRNGENLQFAFFQPAQVGARVEDFAKLVGIAFIQAVEILLDHGFDAGTIVTHASAPEVRLKPVQAGIRGADLPRSGWKANLHQKPFLVRCQAQIALDRARGDV